MKNSDRGELVEPCETLCLGDEISLAARLELVAKNSSLTAGFFDGDLHVADLSPEILPHLAFDLPGKVFSQQLRARVDDRQKNDVPSRQDKFLFFVEYFDRFSALSHSNRRAVRLNQSAMIESVTDLFNQRLKRDEVQHHARAVQVTFNRDRNLIVVSMQRLSAAVSKNQKMRRCEIEIVFCDFDAETTWHDPEGT